VQTSPAAERNKDPILAVLRSVLPAEGLVLEIASGTGQHVVHFARALPRLDWQPSEPDPDMAAIAAARIAEAGLANIRPVLPLDVRTPWPIEAADAVICINMIHIAPWAACVHLVEGASRLLPAGGILFLYGPYRRDGRHTAPSNASFDADLRRHNPEWGVRDLERVAELAASHGFSLASVVPMPANNFSVVFSRQG
jgi:SAM-dependent methyltransferase